MTEYTSSAYEGNKKYFDWRMRGLPHFIKRFPNGIDFQGKRVIDLGCGHGALSCIAAREGASEVLAVDINAPLVEFAQKNQQERFPDTIDVLRFESRDILDGGLSDYDIVVSEATFEHVIGLDRYLEGICDLLKVGGKLYTGYSPLYNSPWGDHQRLKAPMNKHLPWMHLLFPQKYLFRRLSRLEDRTIESLEDLGLNGMSFREHEACLRNSPMEVMFFQANNQSRGVMKGIEVLRAIPGLRELLTFSIYAVLEKKSVA